MTIKYNTIQRGNPADTEYPKRYFPSIQASGRLTLRQLAERASKRSTMTPTDMIGAIEALLAIIPEELAEGKIVELGDFGSFWLKVDADGVENSEDVGASQINSVRPRFIAGKEFKRTLRDVTFSKN